MLDKGWDFRLLVQEWQNCNWTQYAGVEFSACIDQELRWRDNSFQLHRQYRVDSEPGQDTYCRVVHLVALNRTVRCYDVNKRLTGVPQAYGRSIAQHLRALRVGPEVYLKKSVWQHIYLPRKI